MITCKEDLVNAYIENDFGELRDLYIEAMNIFGVKSCSSDGFEYLKDRSFFGVWDWWFGAQTEWSRGPFADGKQLTIKDLKKEKPKPTKFVKVEESIFDLKGEFERGELYCKNLCVSDDYTKLNTEVALFGCAAAGNVYRQVEIDWRDEVKKLGKSAIFHDDGDLFLIIDSNSNDFISMCHEIASLTEKPTN